MIRNECPNFDEDKFAFVGTNFKHNCLFLQIYALNHLMRDLEQEQFRQFCALKSVPIDKHEDTSDNNEDTKKNILT